MVYHVEYAASVEKDLRRLPKETAEKALLLIKEKILPNPYLGISLKGKYRHLRKFRFGDYRIIYALEQERVVVFILRIRHRKDVYRGLIY